MSYGVELYNATGKLTYSTEMTTWNYVGSFIAPANKPVTKSFEVLTLFSRKLTYISFINTPLLAGESKVSTISFSGAKDVVSDGTNTVDVLVVVLAQ